MSVAVWNWAMTYHFTETDKKCFVTEEITPEGSNFMMITEIANSTAEDINVSRNFQYITGVMYLHAVLLTCCSAY